MCRKERERETESVNKRHVEEETCVGERGEADRELNSAFAARLVDKWAQRQRCVQ